jgi:hypothetical protein
MLFLCRWCLFACGAATLLPTPPPPPPAPALPRTQVRTLEIELEERRRIIRDLEKKADDLECPYIFCGRQSLSPLRRHLGVPHHCFVGQPDFSLSTHIAALDDEKAKHATVKAELEQTLAELSEI